MESVGHRRRSSRLHAKKARHLLQPAQGLQVVEAFMDAGDNIAIAYGDKDTQRAVKLPAEARCCSQISKAAVFLPSAVNGL